ncbi:hypothetical protein QG516_25645 [Pedobacter gandavensis]|uniref:hypothetical protein n=1 Tax=Pedobacter gandavensis TaxID=2679963 RepID=UPI0024791820|nr:hypothetical protein [Pedobacter gandavensis]WGQ09901.1 hypothetical protein QG516_25645 [Pedobacter gandavensis]
MNKISSNIKKIALSLLVVGLAVGFSAFQSTVTTPSAKFAISYYGWNEDLQQYQKLPGAPPNLNPCEEVGVQKCAVYLDSEAASPEIIPVADLGDYTLTPYSTSGTGSYFN